MSSELKNLKNDLTLNFNLKDIYIPATEDYIKSKWGDIISWLKTMLEKGSSEKCYQEIYMEIDDLLINDIPQDIIKSIEKVLSNFSDEIKNRFNGLTNQNGAEFFNSFNNLWSATTKKFNLLRKIMNKYEKITYGNIQKNNVYEIFLSYLKISLVNDNAFIQHSISQVLNEISSLREQLISQINNNNNNCLENNNNNIIMEDEKNEKNEKNYKYSELINSYLEKIFLSMKLYCETGIYQEFFNNEFIKFTEDYYNKKTSEYINNNTLEKYIVYVEEILQFENYLIITHLNEITLKPILNKLNCILLNNNTQLIFSKFFSSEKNNTNQFNLIQKFELMKKIYLLFKNIKLEEEIKKKLNEYIIKCCKEIYNKYSKNFLLFYQNIDLLKKNIDQYEAISFLNDDKFRSACKESLTKGMNQKPNFICDIFSKYIDDILRNAAGELPLSEIKEKINEYIILFKYIESKDLFENYFIKKLCIRCLYNLNKSEDAQNYLIEQLKNECGTFFVAKSQEMISDIKSSFEMSQNFNEENKENGETKISYYVLSNYTWPVEKLITANISSLITNNQKKFYDYYHKKNSGKSLYWYLPFCSGELEMSLPENSGEKIKIICNGVHAAILVCFTKSQNSLTLKEIINKTKLEKENITLYIKKLVDKKILKNEGEVYSVNYEVEKDNGSKEIMLIDYNEEDNAKSVEEKEQKSLEERKFVIDAYIMKVLKQKKHMFREDLVSSVKEKMPFEEKDEIVEKRIEQLIDNRYISRDEKKPNLLKYC